MNYRPAEHRLPAPRRGLTLIELVVVMAILAALAGILIPTLSGMLTRAHASSSATNISEVAKLIQTYHTQYLGYPDNFDSLVTGTTGTPATYLVGGGADLTSVTLNDELLESLNGAGIKHVAQMVEATANTTTGNFKWSPTFYPYAAPATGTFTPASTTLTDASVLMGLTGGAAAREFGASPNATYVMFGLGKYSTLSKNMLEAPIHFGESADGAPNVSYARYLVVFQLSDGTTANLPLEQAKLVGIVALHDDAVASVGSHLKEYYAAD